MKSKMFSIQIKRMALSRQLAAFRQDGKVVYEKIDNEHKNFTYHEKIAALSEYLDQYALMSSDQLQRELKKRNLRVSSQDGKNIVQLILDDEEQELFSILEKKNKSDPYIPRP